VQYLAANKFMMQLITSVLSARALIDSLFRPAARSFDDGARWQNTKTLCEWIVRSAHSKWAETKAVRALFIYLFASRRALSFSLSLTGALINVNKIIPCESE
jgi:hypothetical protein